MDHASPATKGNKPRRRTVRASRIPAAATILIVDDLSASRALLVMLLRDQGHRLLEAANGQEALAMVQAEHPDLVITDVLMPVMDGYEFVRQLRLDPAISKTLVVFCTAHYGEREARALALTSGVSDVLTKPLASADVLRIVGRVLSGEGEAASPPVAASFPAGYDREHLRLLTNTLSTKTGDLRAANARLRALINIGLEFGSRRNSEQLLESVCAAVHDLFGGSYVTLGIVDVKDRTVSRTVTCGGSGADWIKCGAAVPGILATVVAERRTLCGENPGGDPAGLQLPSLHPEIRAYLAAPIASPSQVYGWICLVGNEASSFTEDTADLLVALGGQVGRIYEMEREILERKRAESALRLEHDRAQRYLDTAQVFLLKLDLEGRIRLVNRYACSVLGWTEDELLGHNWFETCVPARLRSALRARFTELVGGDLSVVESAVLTKSGEERLIEWRNTLVRDDGGQVFATFSSGADITERARAAEALQTAEARMRFALQSANVGIWDQDYSTGVLRWSETIEAHYGLQPGSFGGTFEAFVERIHPDDRAQVLDKIEKASKAGEDFSVEHRTILPDGTVRWLTGAGRVHLDEHGEPRRAVGISMDVTQRRSLEEQYQQAQKMEAMGRLAGGVAHDFNNLLTVILGYCELLLEDLDPKDPRQTPIAEIRKAGLSAAGLTRQLLAFSRKEMIEPTVLDLNAVTTDMRALLGRLIREDVKVVVVLQPGLAPVKADRGQMEQILVNLAVNAADAMPGGGTLTIETADVELDEHYPTTHLAAKAGRYVRLTVTDTGTGMTPQVQARLFEPFFTTKELGRGTGLGLATVHGIVKQSGGSINVYSELGRGTSFKVYFPRADITDVIVKAPPPAGRPRVGAQTVLLVEDAEGLRELTRRLLERQGYKVLVAANADEAIRLFERNVAIDVLLTDVVMPGASGPELTERLVAQRPGLKVIYMSGYTAEAIREYGGLKPGIAFLHKPFTSQTLGQKIREVVDQV